MRAGLAPHLQAARLRPRDLLRRLHDPALIGYTTTTPDPRTSGPRDPRFTTLGDLMDGFRSVGAFEPSMDGYFGWLAQKGFGLPKKREDIWLPEGMDAVPGVTDRPCRIPAELSDSAYFTERALTYLKGRNGKPWFLHLGYYRPHPPFIAPAPYHAMYAPADMPGPVRRARWEEEAAQHPLLRFYLRDIRQGSFFHGAGGAATALDEAAIRQMRATYAGLISEVDDCLGQVFAYLEETGQWEETMIVFTSDHGEQLGDHWLLGKVGYHDESFRIPLVVKDAGANPRAGAIEDAFTESVDVMPTILDALGGQVPRACDGASLLPLLEGAKPADWRDALFYEYDFRDVHYSQPEAPLGLSMDESALCVVQDARWKYVHFAALPPLFFDLARDPHGFENLADDPAHAGLVNSGVGSASMRLGGAAPPITQASGLARQSGLASKMSMPCRASSENDRRRRGSYSLNPSARAMLRESLILPDSRANTVRTRSRVSRMSFTSTSWLT
ncbi:sulfatase-like hydrolase/transferase [Leptolyngbya sp. 15MV]|nr:sulfatase-like hydrolase/transferase [Leptolyngbya sp. 15MV]